MVYTIAERPAWHPKGEKVLMKIPYGKPIPPGVILGKDTLIYQAKEDSDGRLEPIKVLDQEHG